MNGTKNESGDTSLYSDNDSNSESGIDGRSNVKQMHHMEVDRIEDESNNWSRQSNAGSSEESDTEGHRDTMNITLESDVSGAGGDPLDALRSPSPISDARPEEEQNNVNHSIRIVDILPNRKGGSSRSGSISPDAKMVSMSGYSSSAEVKSPMEVRSRSASPVEVKSGSSSLVDINSESDVESSNDEKEINTIDSDTDDEDCMIVDDKTKAEKLKKEGEPAVTKKEGINNMGEGEEINDFKETENLTESADGKQQIKIEENKNEKQTNANEETEKKNVDLKTDEEPPTVRRSLRNTQRKKYEEPGEDDVDDSDEDSDKKVGKSKSPPKPLPMKLPNILSVRAPLVNTPQPLRFPNAIHRPDMSKNVHNGVVSSNVINNMAQRGVSITPAPRSNSSIIMPPKKPPPKPKRQPPFPPDSIFANMSPDTNIIEAPSFLSPFIFVKKPIESLKKFVDEMGKQIEDEKKRQEEIRLEEERKQKEELEQKEKLEKEKMEKEMMDLAEKANNGETMDVDGVESKVDQDATANTEEKTKKKTVRKRRRDEDNDDSWSEGDVSESSEEDEEPDTIVLKEKPDELDILKVPTIISKEEIKSDLDPKVQAYFSTPLGNFFIDIGFNLVQERVQTDLLKLQQKKMRHSPKSIDVQSVEAAMNLLTSNIERLKRDNIPFNFSHVRCQFCSFKTESALVMANHMEVPHTAKNGLFRCNFCPTEFQSPQLILAHVSSEHGVTARLLKPQSSHECPECPFESQTKGRYLKHIEKCSKLQSEVNILKPQEWQPPAKLIKASARPSYNYNYRPRVPPVPKPGLFRPVQPTSTMVTPQRIVRPAEGFSPSVIGMRPRPIAQPPRPMVLPPRPVVVPPRPNQTIANTNLKCGMCGSYYPDAIRLREHVIKDHARVLNACLT